MNRIPGLMIFCFVLASGGVWARPGDQWIKDEKASSRAVLTSGQAFRLAPQELPAALKLVRTIMEQKLHLSLAEFNPRQHLQSGETTQRTGLPESIAPKNPVMASEDYFFVLEASLKAEGRKTRIMVEARPAYRMAGKAGRPNSNSVEIKIQGNSSQAVGLGPIFVMPAAGQPADFNLPTLPDGAERAALLVRSFMYYWDQTPDSKIPEPDPRP